MRRNLGWCCPCCVRMARRREVRCAATLAAYCPCCVCLLPLLRPNGTAARGTMRRNLGCLRAANVRLTCDYPLIVVGLLLACIWLGVGLYQAYIRLTSGLYKAYISIKSGLHKAYHRCNQLLICGSAPRTYGTDPTNQRLLVGVFWYYYGLLPPIIKTWTSLY